MRPDFLEQEFDRLTERELEVLRRIAGGSSDQDIAQELYLSINTIKWHNRNIYAKLGVESRTQALAAALEKGLLEKGSLEQSPSEKHIRHNLPAPMSSFVGREKELGLVLDLLDSTRLLTLTGTAGVGKTRLALQTAARLAERDLFKDGIYFLELAPVEAPEGVGDALVAGLNLYAGVGSTPAEVLRNYLARKEILLLIDNFEHLLPAAKLIHELLATAPGLKVLATSREALQLSGEQVFTVSPLVLPDLDSKKPLKTLSQAESMELFLQRSRAAKPDFYPLEKELPLLARICTRLDGLPLALELAAARMDFYRPRDLLKALDQRFAVLTKAPREAPDRHQTLQKAIDWSYRLLSEEEQTLFNRLAVFQGGRSFEAAEWVCCQGLELDVLDGLSSLHAKHLIQQEEALDGELRFTMLETLHAYARERLQESGEAEVFKNRHAQYFTELAEKSESHIRGGPLLMRWLKLLKSEHANLRAAVDWSFHGGDQVLGLRLVGTLDPYWEFSGTGKELQGWLGEALELSEDAPPRARAKILSLAGTLYFYAREFQLSCQFYQEALAIFQELGDQREAAWTLALLISLSEENPADYPQVPEYFQQAKTLFSQVEDQAGLSYLYMMFGKYHEKSGNHAEAKRAYQSALEIAEKSGDKMRVNTSLLGLGSIAFWEGDFEESLRLMQQGLRVELSLGYLPVYTVGTLIAMSFPCKALGFPRRAAVMLSAGSTSVFECGFDARPQTKIWLQKMKDDLREEMGETILEQAWAQGAAMDPEEAVSYALEDYDN